MNVSGPAILVVCGTLIVIILVLFWHPQRPRTKTSPSADRQRNAAIFRDDERYWYGGVFYNNPDDPAMFVPKRFGLGWTMNFGHPRAWMFVVGILVLVLLFGVLFPLLFSGLTPIGCHPSGCYPPR